MQEQLPQSIMANKRKVVIHKADIKKKKYSQWTTNLKIYFKKEDWTDNSKNLYEIWWKIHQKRYKAIMEKFCELFWKTCKKNWKTGLGIIVMAVNTYYVGFCFPWNKINFKTLPFTRIVLYRRLFNCPIPSFLIY